MTKIGTKKLIGKVRNFYSKLLVITLEPSCALKVGDTIRIMGGRSTDFTQTVKSMELNSEKIEQANVGDLIGIKVQSLAQKGCKVYLIEE